MSKHYSVQAVYHVHAESIESAIAMALAAREEPVAVMASTPDSEPIEAEWPPNMETKMSTEHDVETKGHEPVEYDPDKVIFDRERVDGKDDD